MTRFSSRAGALGIGALAFTIAATLPLTATTSAPRTPAGLQPTANAAYTTVDPALYRQVYSPPLTAFSRGGRVTAVTGVPSNPRLFYMGAAAPAATMASTTGQWWTMLEKSFIEAADAMPEEKWTFKPSGGAFDTVRTFAEQVKHVACANEAFASEVAHKEPPPACETGGPNPAKTKAEIMGYLRQSFAQMNDVFVRMTPANALEAAGGRYGGPSTRLGLATLAVWHASDHYGQLVVYLRMNGIVPPASR